MSPARGPDSWAPNSDINVGIGRLILLGVCVEYALPGETGPWAGQILVDRF